MAVRRRLVSLLTSGLIVGLLILYFLPPKDAHAAFAAPRGYRVLATYSWTPRTGRISWTRILFATLAWWRSSRW